jgi:hypothetical protein
MTPEPTTCVGWPAILTREQAAAYLNVTPEAIDELVRRTKLKAFYFGEPCEATMRFARRALDEMLRYGMNDLAGEIRRMERTAAANSDSDDAAKEEDAVAAPTA